MKKAPKKPIPAAMLDDDDDDMPPLFKQAAAAKKTAVPAALLDDDDDEDWRPLNAREEKNVTPAPETAPTKPSPKMTPERPAPILAKQLPAPPANFGNLQTANGDRITITSVIGKDGKDVICWHHRMACSLHMKVEDLMPREDVALVIAYARQLHANP